MSSERWRIPSSALALPGALVLCAACADFSRGASLGSDGGAAAGSSSSSGSSYGADIHALLLDGCVSCHASAGAAAGSALVFTGKLPEDYLSTLALVDRDAPAASRLVVKMEGRGHAGGAIYTSASPEHAEVLRWIGEGAAP